MHATKIDDLKKLMILKYIVKNIIRTTFIYTHKDDFSFNYL